MRKHLKKLGAWIRRYEPHLSAASVVVGFVIDNVALARVDQLFDNLMFVTHIVLLSVEIFILLILSVRPTLTAKQERLYLFLPFLIQFSFGALFSGFTVFYSRSGSFAVSLPFMLILFGLIIGNELLRKKYEILAFQINIFFLLLLLFFIYTLPILTGEISARMFIFANLVSVGYVSLYMYILFWAVPRKVKSSFRYIMYGIAGTLVLINTLYFTNSIPAIPLSLKTGELAHMLTHTSKGYVLLQEDTVHHWWDLKRQTVHIIQGERLYVFSSVFAPTRIKTAIVHKWQYKNPKTHSWETIAEGSFAITGGRDEGYRGYSKVRGLQTGLHRVDVETPRGQVIGRITFWVDVVDDLPYLQEKIY